jgi:hypothetical protein
MTIIFNRYICAELRCFVTVTQQFHKRMPLHVLAELTYHLCSVFVMLSTHGQMRCHKEEDLGMHAAQIHILKCACAEVSQIDVLQTY